MLDQLPSWLAAALAALGILGALTAIARGMWRTDSIKDLRSDNDILRARLQDRADEIADLKSRVADLVGEVDKLRQAIETLERMKSAQDQVVELSRHLDDHHRESLTAWARIETTIKEALR